MTRNGRTRRARCSSQTAHTSSIESGGDTAHLAMLRILGTVCPMCIGAEQQRRHSGKVAPRGPIDLKDAVEILGCIHRAPMSHESANWARARAMAALEAVQVCGERWRCADEARLSSSIRCPDGPRGTADLLACRGLSAETSIFAPCRALWNRTGRNQDAYADCWRSFRRRDAIDARHLRRGRAFERHEALPDVCVSIRTTRRLAQLSTIGKATKPDQRSFALDNSPS